MPDVTFQHCIVKVNATHLFSAGGYPYNRNVWLLDFYNDRWTIQKPITHLRCVQRLNAKKAICEPLYF